MTSVADKRKVHPSGGPVLRAQRCQVLGVLNVTPDSFSDGGKHLAVGDAVRHGLKLLEDGADLIDVGGESTRPGATRTSQDEESMRVIPVVRELTRAGAAVSIDTMRAAVAAAAIEAGARMINDVSCGLADPDMVRVVAESDVPYVAMHGRAQSAHIHNFASHDDVVSEVVRDLHRRLGDLVAAGIPEDSIVLDPGLGFAKSPEHNWALLTRLGELHSIGRPLMVGASRKRFLGDLLDEGCGAPPPHERDAASAAVSALAASAGVSYVRVHDVRASIAAVKVAHQWRPSQHHLQTTPSITARRIPPAHY